MTENRRPSAPWLALAVLALGLFMTLLDLTIVNVAIPSIVYDLHASLDQILWVLNGYSLAYAVLLITSGRLGDIFGARNMLAAGRAVSFVCCVSLLPDLRPCRRQRLDWTGVALATAGLLGIVFGLIEGQRYDWGTVWSWITIPEIIAAGVAVLVLFFLVQWRRQDREPLLPFAIFKDRNYTLMTLVLMAMGFAIVGFFLPLTIFYQSVLGLSAFDAGLAIAP